jgi:transposase
MEYGAIDLHTRDSEIRIITETGAEVLSRRVPTRTEALGRIFVGRAPMRVLLETGTESEWVAQQLEAWGHAVVVADPNFAPMYGERHRRVKTDRRDVTALAEANRRGWYRAVHRVSASQRAVRQALQVRRVLIQQRTQTISVLRTLIRQTGVRVPTGAAETMVARVQSLTLPVDLQATVAPLLTVLNGLAPLIAAADAATVTQAQADPVTRRLQTIPGIGPVTAVTYRATVDDVSRFPDAAAVTSYLGLIPREKSSGAHQARGGITKAGPRELRSLLVQAAWSVWRTRGPAAHALRAWAHRLAARRGKRIAVVALARRLARIAYAVWRDARPFTARTTEATMAA